MKSSSIGAVALGVVFAFSAAGCSTGKPGFRRETLRPDRVHDFATLYKQNCSACHGDKGSNGAALPLDNPVYLTWAGHDRIAAIVSSGVPHRLMPAFGRGGGGLLTDEQVQDIVNGMISHWTRPGNLNGADAPGYAPSSPGNAARGSAAFQTYCARCHGADGKGTSANAKTTGSESAPGSLGSIVDPTFLSLISSQGLRDIVVSGMPGEGMPDWREDVAGKPMSDQDVTNIVAWLTSLRVQFPGQSFPSSQQQ